MVLEEAGDFVIPMKEGLIRPEDIAAEIGEVASDKKAGRLTAEEVTFFKTVGVAAQDIVLASRVLRKAMDQGLGCLFNFYGGRRGRQLSLINRQVRRTLALWGETQLLRHRTGPCFP